MPEPLALSELFPAAETLTLRGRPVAVAPLRLRDLLEMERQLAALSPSPWEMLLATDDGSGPPRRLLREAMTAARDWPPRLGGAAARELSRTVAGGAIFLATCTRGRLAADEAVELAAAMTAAEWAAVGRVAWGVRPPEAIRRMAEGVADRGDEAPAEPVDWAAIVEAIDRERGLGYEAVLDLPLVQVHHMLRRGEPPPGRPAPADPMGHLRRMAAGAAWYDPDEELPDYLVRAREDLAYAEAHGLDALAARAAARRRAGGPPPGG